MHFNGVFRLDPRLQQWLADNPAIARGLANGDIDIRNQLVRTDGNGVVRIEDLALDARSLDLRGEGVPARQPELVSAGVDVRGGAVEATAVDDPRDLVANQAGLHSVPLGGTDTGHATAGEAVAQGIDADRSR